LRGTTAADRRWFFSNGLQPTSDTALTSRIQIWDNGQRKAEWKSAVTKA